MKRTFALRLALFSAASLLVFSQAAVAQQTNSRTSSASGVATTDTFDPDGYYRMRVTMDYEGQANRFSTAHCPTSNILNFDISQLLARESSHTLTIGIEAPAIAVTEAQLYNIEVSREGGILNDLGGLIGVGKSECVSSFHRVDLRTPLMTVAGNDALRWTVGVRFTEQKDAPTLVNSVLPELPFNFLREAGSLEGKLSDAYSQTNRIVDRTDLSLAAGGTRSDEWQIPGDQARGIPDVRIRAALEPVPSYFTRPAAGWTPNAVLRTPMPAGTPGGATTFGEMARAVPGFVEMISSNQPEAFDIACRQYTNELSDRGFSNSDQALLVWAAAVGRANLANDPRIYDRMCLEQTFVILVARADTQDIDSSPVGAVPDPVVPDRTAMQRTIETGLPLIGYFRRSPWQVRRPLALALFDFDRRVNGQHIGLAFFDQAGLGILQQSEMTLSNPDQWELNRNQPSPFASEVGCYSYIEGDDGAQSRMIALADFGEGGEPREIVIDALFSPTIPGQAARIDTLVLREPEADDLARIRADHAGACNVFGWRASILDLATEEGSEAPAEEGGAPAESGD